MTSSSGHVIALDQSEANLSPQRAQCTTARNVRFEIPYKVLYFETPFLIIFKYYAWVSCVIIWAIRKY